MDIITNIEKPLPDEYSNFAAGYVAQVGTHNVLQLLADLKVSSFELFYHLNDEKANSAYAPGKWTIKQVIGHLIDTERVFAYRAFAFSREETVLPGFDQDVYIAQSNYLTADVKDLALEYKAVREANLYLFKSLDFAQQCRKGVASGSIFSVRAFIYMIAGHELHHLAILKEKYLRS